MKTTIELNTTEIGVTTYAGYAAYDETDVETIHPLTINTHRLNPFEGNQGVIKFTCPGDKLLGAIETHPKRIGNEIFHFLVPGGPSPAWDYARTFSLVEPTIGSADIVSDKEYDVTLVGGSGYVHIKEGKNVTTINAREFRVITIELDQHVNVGHEWTFEHEVLDYLSYFDNILSVDVLGSTLRILTSDDYTSGIVGALARNEVWPTGRIFVEQVSSFVTSYEDGDTTWETTYDHNGEDYICRDRHCGTGQGCFFTNWSEPWDIEEDEFWNDFGTAWESGEVIDFT